MLDQRVRELADTVFSVGLDWLGSEIIGGALAGRVAEEPQEALIAARELATRTYQDRGLKFREVAAPSDPEPYSGEEQLEWACAHVGRRLSEALAMMQASADTLDRVIDGERGSPAQKTTVLVLDEPERKTEVTRGKLEVALAELNTLRLSISEWATSVRGDQQ